jgi:Protein of unknown function (DUF5818)
MESTLMKNFLVRMLLAAALILLGFALASSAQAQQADEDRAPTAPRRQQSTPPRTSPQQPEVPAPSANDIQTQQALAFTGRVANEQGRLVLQDPVTKMSYRLDDQSKSRPYVGKHVKVIGKLEMKSNTILIDSIEPVS